MIHSQSTDKPITFSDTPDLEQVMCDFCGSDQRKILGSLPPLADLRSPMHRLGGTILNFAGKQIDFCECSVCGLVYMNPRLTEPAIARFYDTVYGHAGASEAFESNQAAYVEYLLDTTAPMITNSAASVLDIGCGAGQFLHAAQKRGFSVTGTELSSVAAERASKLLNVSIYPGDFRDMNLPPESFDLVTLLAVVEHLRAPVSYLCDSAALLKPGGILLIKVPNVASTEYGTARLMGQLWRGFILEHLYYFTPNFMQKLIDGLGLETLKMSTWNPNSRYPNPLRDFQTVSSSVPTAPPPEKPARSIPPLKPMPLPQRILRQLNNYLLDTVSKMSEGTKNSGWLSGNSLYVWARKK